MGLVFKGGTSGNRQDALPSVPSSGTPQPVLDTSNNKDNPEVHLQSEHFRPHRHGQQATATFMPTGGAVNHFENGVLTNPTTPDVMQQDIIPLGPGSGDSSVFRGTRR